MKELKKRWQEMNGQNGVITIRHKLFGTQKISVDKICTFWDDRVGLTIKDQEIYILIKDIISYVNDNDKVLLDSKMKKIEIKLSF